MAFWSKKQTGGANAKSNPAPVGPFKHQTCIHMQTLWHVEMLGKTNSKFSPKCTSTTSRNFRKGKDLPKTKDPCLVWCHPLGGPDCRFAVSFLSWKREGGRRSSQVGQSFPRIWTRDKSHFQVRNPSKICDLKMSLYGVYVYILVYINISEKRW